MEYNMAWLRHWLRREIDQLGLSHRQFAKLAGLSHSTINRLLDESQVYNHAPDTITLQKLATATDTDLAWLISQLMTPA
jgi:transcriptional regulator with XRE-family HTH domain